MNTEKNVQKDSELIGDNLPYQEGEYFTTKQQNQSSSFKQQSNMRSEVAFQPNQFSKSQTKQSVQKTELNTTEMEKKNEYKDEVQHTITTYKTTKDQDQQLNSKKWIIVSNFIKKIKKQSSSVRFFQSCKKQIDIINDKSVYYKYYFYKNTFINELFIFIILTIQKIASINSQQYEQLFRKQVDLRYLIRLFYSIIIKFSSEQNLRRIYFFKQKQQLLKQILDFLSSLNQMDMMILSQCLQIIYQIFFLLIKQLILFNKDSTTSRLWRIFQCILLLMYVLYLPIRISFDALHRNNTIFFFFEILPNLAQIFNIFIEFNSDLNVFNLYLTLNFLNQKGFYKNGVVVNDRTKITLYYLKGRFSFDIVLGICWFISLSKEASLWFKVIGMIRIIAFFQFLSEIEQFSGVKEYLGSYFDLIKLGGFIFFCAHLTGCCWYALAKYEQNKDVPITWLDKDFANFDMEDKIDVTVKGYIASFYWAIITMCTVGYGDVGPMTYRERVFAIFICLLASFLFAFSMNSIDVLKSQNYYLGEIIKNIRQNDEEFKNKMMMLNLHMKQRKLNKLLQMRVRKHYEYLFLEQKQSNEQGSQMIEDLTPALRDDVLKDIYTNIFNKEKIFKLNFSDKFIDSIYQLAKEKKYGVDEYIYIEQDNPQHLFFILQGEVEILLQNRVVLQTLGEGQFVGASNFFGDYPYSFKAKTTTFTQFLVINKDEFVELLKKNEKDYQSYCQIKDKIIQQQDASSIGHSCESCQQFGHIFSDCQMIKFNKNKFRQSWKRSDNSCQTLKETNNIQDSINCFYEHVKDLQLKECKIINPLKIVLKFKYFLIQDEAQQVQSDENEDDNFENLESFREEDEDISDSIQNNEIHIEQIQEEQIETLPNDTEVVNLQDDVESHDVQNKFQKEQRQNTQNEDNKYKAKEEQENSNNQLQFITSNSHNQGLLSQEDFIYEDTQQDGIQSSGCKLINSPQFNLSNLNIDKFSNKFSISSIENNNKQFENNNKQFENNGQQSIVKSFTKKRSLFSNKMLSWKKEVKNTPNNKESKRRQSTQIDTFGAFDGMKQSEYKRSNYQQSHKRNLSLPLNMRRESLLVSKSPIQIKMPNSTKTSPTKDNIQKFFGRQDIIQDNLQPSNLGLNISNKHQRRGTNFSVNDTESVQSNSSKNQNKKKIQLKSQGSVILDIIQQSIEKENRIIKQYSDTHEVEQGFDTAKDFEVYFTHNNPSSVIDKLNKINRKNKKYKDLIKKQQAQKPQKQKNMQFEKKSINVLNKKTNQPQKSSQQKYTVYQNKPLDTINNKTQQPITESDAKQETDRFIKK